MPLVAVAVLLSLVVAVVFALVRGTFARSNSVSASCVALLGAITESLIWWPPYFSESHLGLSVVFLALNPIYNALILASSALAVPLISIPSLALGTAAGTLAGWGLWRLRRPRLAALVWVCVTPVVAWFAAELIVSAELRRSAAVQFPGGYCRVLSRQSVSSMIRKQAYEERSEHAIIVADGVDYFWSFRERRFVTRGNKSLGYACDTSGL